MQKDLLQFEQQTALTFKNKSILKQAFTHRSYLNENKNSGLKHNERLEFLGDAVLELIVTDHLYKKYPDVPEGELTSYRAALVNFQTLGKLAAEIGMGDYVLLSHGQSRDTDRARVIILANTFEAVLGAIYIDQGYDAALGFVERYLFPLIDTIVEQGMWVDAKSHFQEVAQEKTGITPKYKTIKEIGPDHDKHFTVGLYIGGEAIVTGEGRSKQEAEQNAARRGLIEKNWT